MGIFILSIIAIAGLLYIFGFSGIVRIVRSIRSTLRENVLDQLPGKPTPEQRAVAQWLRKPRPGFPSCVCKGKQNDDPACPCDMRWHERVDGHWYKISERGGDVIAERAH